MDKLQEWLKDKKNQPIVAGVLVLVLVGAGFFLYTQMTATDGSDASTESYDTSSSYSDQSASTSSTATTAANTTTNAQPANQSAAKPADVKSVKKNDSAFGRVDPFLPVGWRPPAPPPPPEKAFVQAPDPSSVELIKRWKKGEKRKIDDGEEPQQPPRRMAGLLLNGRIYAILESNGSTELVQPGDRLKDGLAVVDRIERDKVVLETIVGEKRFIVVRMSSASKMESSSATTNPNTGFKQPAYPPIGGTGMPRGM